jgi:hypothetical protein
MLIWTSGIPWRTQVLGHLAGGAAGGDVKVVAKRDAADEGAADAVPLAGDCQTLASCT